MDGRPAGTADRDVVVEGIGGEETSRDQPIEVGRDGHLQGIRPNPINADHQNPPGLLLSMNGG